MQDYILYTGVDEYLETLVIVYNDGYVAVMGSSSIEVRARDLGNRYDCFPIRFHVDSTAFSSPPSVFGKNFMNIRTWEYTVVNSHLSMSPLERVRVEVEAYWRNMKISTRHTEIIIKAIIGEPEVAKLLPMVNGIYSSDEAYRRDFYEGQTKVENFNLDPSKGGFLLSYAVYAKRNKLPTHGMSEDILAVAEDYIMEHGS